MIYHDMSRIKLNGLNGGLALFQIQILIQMFGTVACRCPFFVGPVNGGHVESGWRNSCVWGTKIRGFTETVNILLNIWKRAKCCTWLGQGFVNHGLRLPEKTLLWHGSMDKNCCHPRFCWWISRCFLNELSEYQPAVSDIEDIDA